MTMQLAAILNRATEVLLEQVAEHPQIAPRIIPVAGLLKLVAADADVHVASRLEEASRIKKILRKAVEIAPAKQLSQVEAVIGLEPSSSADYASPALETYLGRLKEALITAHAWLETADVPAREALLEEIWDYLTGQAKAESRLVTPLW